MAPAPNCRILGVVMSVGNLPVLQERLESVRSNAVAGSHVRIAALDRNGRLWEHTIGFGLLECRRFLRNGRVQDLISGADDPERLNIKLDWQ